MILPYSRIFVNTVPDRYEREELLRVDARSPMPLRTEVERLARYFRRELHYDFMQYDRHERDDQSIAYLLVSHETVPPVWAGACCFRTRDYKDFGPNVQTLDWVWIHPFFRREGLLQKHWTALHQAHGDFAVERPVSGAMRCFLRKHNGNSRFSQFYEPHRED